MSEGDVELKTSASAARFLEAMQIVREQICQLNALMTQAQPIEDTQAEQDDEA
jgi:hypothetical protein